MFKSILIDGNGTTSFHAGHLSRCLGFRIIFRDPNDDTHYQPDQVDGKSFIYLLLFLIIWDLKRYREKDVILSLFCLVGGKVKKKISFVLFCFICSRTFPHAFLGSKRAPLFFFFALENVLSERLEYVLRWNIFCFLLIHHLCVFSNLFLVVWSGIIISEKGENVGDYEATSQLLGEFWRSRYYFVILFWFMSYGFYSFHLDLLSIYWMWCLCS